MFNVLSILLALVILGVCVMIHEFGHYIVGKKCGIGVVEFAVGMGPKIFGWERNGTKYSLRAIPLGGFCAFVGEDEDNADPRAMNNQPVWKRFITVLAGPFMNFFLAFVLAVIMLSTGQIADPSETVTLPVLYGVDETMPAGKAGLQAGDVVTHVDGEAITQDDAGVEALRSRIMAAENGQTVEVTVDRNGESMVFSLAPEYSEADGRMLIGITFAGYYMPYDVTVLEAIPESMKLMGTTVVQTVDFLKDMVGKLITGQKVEEGSVSGVVGIVSNVSTGIQEGFGDAFSSGIYTILFWLLNISLSLGIMNLLPIPALDGGRLLFLTVEGITRKPLNRNAEAIVNLIGFAILIGLMVVVTVSDIKSLIR